LRCCGKLVDYEGKAVFVLPSFSISSKGTLFLFFSSVWLSSQSLLSCKWQIADKARKNITRKQHEELLCCTLDATKLARRHLALISIAKFTKYR